MMKQVAGAMVGSLHIPKKSVQLKRFISQEGLESYQHSGSSFQLQPSEIEPSVNEAEAAAAVHHNEEVNATASNAPPLKKSTVANATNASGTMASSKQKANQMQIEAYAQKNRELQHKIEEMELELQKFKQENEALIFDLRDSKTKVAVLEEKKAQLQIELINLRKLQKTMPSH